MQIRRDPSAPYSTAAVLMRKIQLAPNATLFHADCRDALRSLPDCSVDSVVTDPPYELNFMGKGWDNTGIANDPALWAEVLRVLKPGGHLAAFSASRTYHRMACAIEDAGFEIRDSLMWVYGTGFPKSQDVSKFIDKMAGAEREVIGERYTTKRLHLVATVVANGEWGKQVVAYTAVDTLPATPAAAEWKGWGTALKPAFEPIVLARKPLSEGTVAANVLRWRTGALNIDGCRIHTAGSEAKACTVKRLKPGATLAAEGGNWRPEGDDAETYEGSTKDGRWPANVVHDGSDEVVGAFPVAGGQQGRAKSGGNKTGSIYGHFASNVTANPEPRGDSGSAARFFYSAKASKADRNDSKHPTVKPISLMEWLCNLITPPGGTVLDPFGGSGTTARAASNKGFGVLICEREAEYVADIRRRFGPALPTSDALRRFQAWNAKALELQAFLDARLGA